MLSHKTIATQQQDETKKSLISIKNNGLCPLSKIPNNISPNPTLGVQSIYGNICVNHVNLKNTDSEQRKDALNIAIYEEYCGIYGIALERKWPMQSSKVPEILSDEISSRLMNSVVFVINRPEKTRIKTTKIPGSKKEIEIGCYESFTEDGFSQQATGKVLLDKPTPKTDCLTEIKTPHVFPMSEVKAILVPEPLVGMVTEIYKNTNIEIIPVSTHAVKLTSIPQILDYMHNEKLSKECEVKAPNYEAALEAISNKYTEFSLHTVRLHSSYDFAPRYIADMQASSELIKSTGSVIIEHDKTNNTGWVSAHKRVATSSLPAIENFGKLNVPKDKIINMKRATESLEATFNKFKNAKGDWVMNHVYSLSKLQVHRLKQLGVKVIKVNEKFFATSIPANFDVTKKNAMQDIINKWDHRKNDAAVKIQSTFKMFRTRKNFIAYKNRKKELEEATLKFKLAEQKLLQSK